MTHDDDQDSAVDALLRSHLGAALGPHVGRARPRFERDARPTLARSTWRWRGVAGVAAAAAVIALSVGRYRPTTVEPKHPPRVAVAPATRPSSAVTVVERDARWQTFDRGIVRLENGSAARLIVQRRLDRVRYFDPGRRTIIECTEPHERVAYVALATY